MVDKYNPGSQFYLPFNFPLHRYLQLAALPLEEQLQKENISRFLNLDETDAQVFVNYVGRVRAFYQRHPVPKTFKIDPDALERLSGRWTLVSPKVTIIDQELFESRDLDLSNVILMSHLGLISPSLAKNIAKILASKGVSPANLMGADTKKLAEYGSLQSISAGNVRQVEFLQLLQALDILPAHEVEKDKARFEHDMVKHILGRNYHPATVNALFGHCSNRVLTRAAGKCLREAGIEAPVIQASLGHYAF